MQALLRAFTQLRLVTSSMIHNTGNGSGLSSEVASCLQPLLGTRTVPHMACVQRCSTKSAPKKDSAKAKINSYHPPSPYKTPGPRRYGYQPGFFTDGLLPRGEDLEPIRSLPSYKVVDKWDKKRALFGQNDYIDILGDGSIKPVDLIHGPDWLIGFKGNELQRLVRRMNFHGDKLKLLYPHKHHNIQKRIFFLYKKYNQKRGKRVGSQRRS